MNRTLVTQTSVLGAAFATDDAAAFVSQGAVRDRAGRSIVGGDLAIVNAPCNLRWAQRGCVLWDL
jgi:hypothetical protein